MRNTLILFILLATLSCGKDKKEIIEIKMPIIYNSEIFNGNDSLIYGKWESLSFMNVSWPKHDLIINPVGNYEKIFEILPVESGKFDTLKRSTYGIRIAFCQDGITSNIKNLLQYFNFRFQGSDTLILYRPHFNDAYEPYYKRIK
jgi:hypothetical protein